MIQEFKANPVAVALGGAVISLVLAGTANADVVREEFDVRDGGTLKIDTDVGKIDVQTSASGLVTVEVVREGSRGEELSVEFEQSGDRISVKGEWPRDDSRWSDNERSRVEFLVSVPRRFNLDLATSGGSIEVEDLDGTLQAHTSGGSLRFGRIEGEVNADTSGGSIRLEGGGSDVRIETSGGSIKVGEVLGKVKAHTSGGSIRITGFAGSVDASTSGGSVEATMATQPVDDCSLSTSGGTVTLYLADGLALDIDASASSGGVRSDFPIDGRTRDKRKLRGSLNGGGPRVHLRTSGGSVRIKSLN